jgi:anti-anti-sigma factor
MKPYTIIEGPGAFCIDTCREVEEQILAGLAADKPLVVVNLSRTESIDGAGLGVLLWTQALARRSGVRLRVVAPSAPVRSFLRHVDLLGDVDFDDSFDEVLRAS